MTGPDLSIVIVNYNGAYWLGRLLPTMRKATRRTRTELILVDNMSSDDSVNIARRLFPDLIVLRQVRNLGYVAANNEGLSHATGRYVMFLNSDTQLDSECLTQLVAFLDRHPQVGAAGPDILNPDGSDQGTARRFPTVVNAIFGRRSLLARCFPNNPWSRRQMIGRHRANDEPFDVEILSSACLVVRRALALELGGMDEDFQLYWVDAELCSRIRDTGYRVCCVPRAKLVHYEGEGGSTRTLRQRFRTTVGFHQDAYYAYVKVKHLRGIHPLSLFAAAALSVRASCLMLVQLARPGRATSSGGRN